MGREYSRESTQISWFSGENAILLVPSEGFEEPPLCPSLSLRALPPPNSSETDLDVVVLEQVLLHVP